MKLLVQAFDSGLLGFLLEDPRRVTEVLGSVRGTLPEPGDVILGQVTDRAEDLGGLFVRILPEPVPEMPGMDRGFLPLRDVPEEHKKIRPGQALPMQLVSGPRGSKPCRLSGQLRIEEDAAEIYEKAQSRTAFSVLYRQPSELILRAMRCAEAIDELLIALPEGQTPKDWVVVGAGSAAGPSCGTFQYPEGTLSEREAQDLELLRASFPERLVEHEYLKVQGYLPSLRRGFARRIPLSSGAELVVDKTEAMTVIDVNSGHQARRGRKDDPDALRRAVNEEAVREIFAQIRLRNLSGIILADLIGEGRGGSQREMVPLMKELAGADPCPCHFVDITALGLAEITRKRSGKSLAEKLGGAAEELGVSAEFSLDREGDPV